MNRPPVTTLRKTIRKIGLMGLAGLLYAAGPSHAMPVMRCGNTYTDGPCPDGQAIEVSDTRTPEQARQQQAITERTRRLADQLETQRHAREAKEQVAKARAAQEARRLLEFEARLRKLEQPSSPAARQVRIAGLAAGNSTLPPLQRVPMYKVPRPVKPLPQGRPADDRRQLQD